MVKWNIISNMIQKRLGPSTNLSTYGNKSRQEKEIVELFDIVCLNKKNMVTK